MEEISAGGVVYRIEQGQVKVMIIKDRFGSMTLPKGKMEAGETIEQTALREIKEETGIDGEIKHTLETIHYTYEHEQLGTVKKTVHYYLVLANSTNITVQEEEIDDVYWVSINEALTLQRNEGYDNNDSVVEKACSLLEMLG
ncbi:NUDIX hydrolase [Longirhabdus pacifica]|uniref:NUDIX hydrolase n=1 Tax=Longirhabdus pacifica TaxID=2305227 RepID=UPI001008BE10|nr:NUDIX hydrolase [Longirhabdus pacifica]